MTMTAKSVPILLAAIGLAGVAGAAPSATADQIIAKARSYLGSESALAAVRSVHFVGTMEMEEASPQGPRKVRSPIEIIFQKPYQQRIALTTEATVQVTGLDDYDGWQQVQERAAPGRWRLALLQPEMIKKLRANTWENLNFYLGIEKRGGSVRVIGPAMVDGVAAVKVVFEHEPGISFTRYFDQATGRLVLTETDRGDRIREEGELMASGVRFPQKVTSAGGGNDTGAKAGTVTVISFERITINETFADSEFEMPMVPESPPPAAPAPAVETPPALPSAPAPPPVAP